MKTLNPKSVMRILRHFLCVISFTIVFVPATGQLKYLQLTSSDTLYAGEVGQLVAHDSGFFSQENLGAILLPRYQIDFPPCPDCFDDTIKAESAITDGFETTITFDIPLGTHPNRFTLVLINDTLGGTLTGEYSRIRVVSKPYVFSSPEDQTICYGEDAILTVTAYEPGSILYQWYHFDELLEGATDTSLYIFDAGPGDEGLYKCVLKNQWGEATTSATISLNLYSIDIGVPEGSTLFCKGSHMTEYSLPENPSIETYDWVLLPLEAGTLKMAGRSVQVQWDPAFSGNALLFSGTGSGECFGPNSDTLTIEVVGPSTTPEICIVGIDETIGKYRVVWNKINNGSVVKYHIYRESNQAGVFLKLKSVTTEEFSVFVDSASSPESLPHSYKISYTDTCGNESELSPAHTTVHLTANLGTQGENNLSWTHYQGFPFLSYAISRGTHPDSLDAFQDVASNVTSFTDTDPPSKRVYYQIVVSRDGACNPTKKAGVDYSLSRSNVFELNTVGVENHLLNKGVLIFPNPALNYVFVEIQDNQDVNGEAVLFDMAGKQVGFSKLKGEKTILPVDQLIDGIYVIRVTTDRFTTRERIVVKR